MLRTDGIVGLDWSEFNPFTEGFNTNNKIMIASLTVLSAESDFYDNGTFVCSSRSTTDKCRKGIVVQVFSPRFNFKDTFDARVMTVYAGMPPYKRKLFDEFWVKFYGTEIFPNGRFETFEELSSNEYLKANPLINNIYKKFDKDGSPVFINTAALLRRFRITMKSILLEANTRGLEAYKKVDLILPTFCSGKYKGPLPSALMEEIFIKAFVYEIVEFSKICPNSLSIVILPYLSSLNLNDLTNMLKEYADIQKVNDYDTILVTFLNGERISIKFVDDEEKIFFSPKIDNRNLLVTVFSSGESNAYLDHEDGLYRNAF